MEFLELSDHPLIFFPVLAVGILLAGYSLYCQWTNKDF